jgi:16S rRNA (adenine1518-N6/adenine1519-N6)-dimethyltransferase
MSVFKKKALGQHFLTRTEIGKQIVEFAGITPEDSVIEIGPGVGALTTHIAGSNPKNILLIELDVRLTETLGRNFPGAKIINADAAAISYDSVFNDYFREGEYLIVGNLPYNASTAILEAICAAKKKPKTLVLMFQKEVAQRITANPGSRIYGRLSLLASEFYKIKQVMQLPPGAFSPPPRVDSSVLMFSLLREPLIEVQDRALYEKILLCAFSNKRKMIKNSLRSLIPKELADDVLLKCGILSDQRPEKIDIRQYAKLADLAGSIIRGDHR